MTSQSRKHRGYRTQKVVAEYLAAHGFPHAESTGAGRSGTDVTGIVGVDIEVKARTGLDLPALMRQMKDRAKDDILGIGVLRLNGQGENAAEYVAVLRFEDLVMLLRDSRYYP